MVSFRYITVLIASAVSVFAAPSSSSYKPGCGQVNVIYTGLPPYHPLVIAQGFDPATVDRGLRMDAANIIKAGYNLRVVLFGPEQPVDRLSDQMRGTIWGVTGVGYGVRGSHLVNVTEQFTEIIQVYRERAPFAQTVFDYSPVSGLWSLQRFAPLSSNCTNSPGKDLGFKIFCDICTSDPNSNNTTS